MLADSQSILTWPKQRSELNRYDNCGRNQHSQI